MNLVICSMSLCFNISGLFHAISNLRASRLSGVTCSLPSVHFYDQDCVTSFFFLQMFMDFTDFIESPDGAGSFGRPHAKFTLVEDELLRSLVERCGTADWSVISEKMCGRNPRQCKERWMNYLSPEINGAGWTREEDFLLIQKQHELGSKWVKIAKFFPNRTDSMVKNRFNRLKRRDQKQKEMFSRREPLYFPIFRPPRYWAQPVTPRLSSEPLPVMPTPDPVQVQIPVPESNESDFSLWSEPFSSSLECWNEDPFELA
jgi:hypothetical protein